MAGTTDDGDLDKRRALLKRLREKKQAQYLQQHSEKIENIAQQCVNRVLYDKPKDPYAALLCKFSEHTQAGVRLFQFRVCPALDRENIQVEVVVSIRGETLIAHVAQLPKALVARGLVATSSDPEAASDEEKEAELAKQIEQADAMPASMVAAQLSALLRGRIRGLDIFGWRGMSQGLAKCVCPPGGVPPSEIRSSALTELRSSLGRVLVDAVGCLMGGADLSLLERLDSCEALEDARAHLQKALTCIEEFALQGKTEADPDVSKTEADPDGGKTEADAEVGKTEADPDGGQTEADPDRGKKEADPDGSKTEADLDVGKAEAPDPDVVWAELHQSFRDATESLRSPKDLG